MAAYPPRLAAVIEMLSLASDESEKAELLLSFADRFTEVPPEIARRPFPEARRVPGCESEAYVWAVPQRDDTLKLYFAVENPSGISAKALATILDQSLSELPAGEIASISPDVVYEIFRRDISMGKGVGLMNMVQAVVALARLAERELTVQHERAQSRPS